METLGHITAECDITNLAALVVELDAKQVIEVGCYVGMTTRGLVDSKPDVVVHAIDHFEGSPNDTSSLWYQEHGKEKIKRTFCENLSDVLFERAFLHVGTSEFYASVWPFQVDLVFIDANHDYEEVKKDIQMWRPHVRPGGFLCGHDYNVMLLDPNTGEFPGVPCGVNQAVGEIMPAEMNGSLWRKQM